MVLSCDSLLLLMDHFGAGDLLVLAAIWIIAFKVL